MAITAIETHYDGYRFRSRLEARWAVFLNTIGLEYDYEPEGLVIPTPVGKIKYLPDFWLPGTGQWGEVKGFLDVASLNRLYNIAVGLTRCGAGNDLVVLGDVPRLHSAAWPVQLHNHGKLWAVPWRPEPGCPLGRPRVAVEPTPETAGHLTTGFPFGHPEWALDALERARCARFEWGESG